MTFGSSPVLLVLCLLAAGAFTYWTYRVTPAPLHPGKKAVLISLRWTALALLLFLLFEPVWNRVVRDTQRPLLALLVDTSQSLALQSDGDPPLSLADSMRAALSGLGLDALDSDVVLYTYDATPRRSAAGLDSLSFEGARTDIATALDFVRDDLSGKNLSGVVLVSDGRYNTGRNPLYTAERYPVPLYTVTVGDTTRRRDVQVRRVVTNDIAYVGRALPVEVSISADGIAGERVLVSLLQEGTRLDAATTTVRDGTESPVTLTYTPQAVGLQRLVISVTRLDGEVTYANNATAVTVQVLENEKRIVVIAASPTPDLAALRTALDADPDLEVDVYTQRAPGQFYEAPLPTDLASADVVVLLGYPGDAADRATAQRLAAALVDRPTLFLLQRNTNLSLLREAFAEVLPVQPAVVRSGRIVAVPSPTPAGIAHPVLELANIDPSDWLRLPPLTASETRWQPAPDARVLATQTVRGIGLDDPMLLVQSRSGRRSAALLGSGWWRWQTLPDDLDDLRSLWPDMLTNLLQWLATREDDRRVRVQPIRDLFGGGEPVEFTGQIYDESLNPVDGATLGLTITAPDGNTFPYTMRGFGNGRYVLDAGALPEGTYRFRAEATTNGTPLGVDQGAFAVGPLTLEFRETTADASLMRQIARRSGGLAFTASEAHALSDAVRATDTLRPTTTRRDEETPLWHLFAFLPVVLVLLTTEWVLRKRSGMV